MPVPLQALADLIIGIDHVGLAVNDLDSAIGTWVDAFGGKIHSREINEEQGVEEVMVQFLDGTQIQLLAALSPESTIGKFLAKHGEGVQQLAFRVTDLTKATEKLEEVGIPAVYPAPKKGTNGSWINFVHPKYTGGVLVELVE